MGFFGHKSTVLPGEMVSCRGSISVMLNQQAASELALFVEAHLIELLRQKLSLEVISELAVAHLGGFWQ